jgi:LacI family transcriptional regulator
MIYRMKDIAARVGVSLTTVSHVLNNTPHRPVAPEVRRRILEVVKELDYHPNANARRLAQRYGNSFGMVISEIANPFFADVIRSFESSADKGGFELLICNTEYEPDRITAAVRRLIENRVRGVAIMTSMFGPEQVEELTRQKIPVVLLGSGPARPYTAYLEIFSPRGMDKAVDHLLELGHRQLVFFSGPQSNSSAVLIRDLFLEATRKRALLSCLVVESNYRVDGGMSATRSLLAKGSFPTAIICGNDLIGLGVISALEEVGLRVPQDVSVIGYDDILIARLSRPPLTTISVPRNKIGLLAFRALQQIMRSKGKPGCQYSLETELVVRKSTAPPKVVSS